MARLASIVVLLALALAGCTGGGTDDGPPRDSTEVPRISTREILSEKGNNDACTQVLTGAQTFSFTVDEGYGAIDVDFHASGLGQVGYEIRDGAGAVVASVADYNPASQPCNHDHTATKAPSYEVAPGTYEVTVRNVGILGWILIVKEGPGAPA